MYSLKPFLCGDVYHLCRLLHSQHRLRAAAQMQVHLCLLFLLLFLLACLSLVVYLSVYFWRVSVYHLKLNVFDCLLECNLAASTHDSPPEQGEYAETA